MARAMLAGVMKESRSKDPASRRLRAFVFLVLGAVALPSLALSGFGLIAIENERGATEDRVRSLYGPVAEQLAAGVQRDLERLQVEAEGGLEGLAAWARRDRSRPGEAFDALQAAHPELVGWFAFEGQRQIWPRPQADLSRSLSQDCVELNRRAREQSSRGEKKAALDSWSQLLRSCAGRVDWRGYAPGLGAGLALLEQSPEDRVPELRPALALLLDALERVGSPSSRAQRMFVAQALLERLQAWPKEARDADYALACDRLQALISLPEGPRFTWLAGRGTELDWGAGSEGTQLRLIWKRDGLVAGAAISPAALEQRLNAALEQQGIAHQISARVRRAGLDREEEAGFPAGQAWLGQGPLAWKLELNLHGSEALDDLADSRTTLYLWLLVVLVLALLTGIGATLAIMYRETRLSRLKTDFVSNISHELRTPLTSIRLYTDTLLMDRVSDEGDRRECLQVIDAETRRLNRLVERILDFSRMEAGRRAYRMRSVEVQGLLERAVEACRPMLEEGGFELEMDLAPELVDLWADPEPMEEVLINLLHNAIKYSGEGRWIGLSARRRDGRILLEVRDRGLGIPKAEQGRIFDKFYRVETELSDKVSGSGLGLSLVRYVVDAHDGRVEVESEPGRGSTFRLILPTRGDGGEGEA